MSKDRDLSPGDRVEWNAHGGKSTTSGNALGRVIKRLTEPMKIKGHEVKASKDNPEYLVESEKSGTRAAHKPSALRRRKKD